MLNKRDSDRISVEDLKKISGAKIKRACTFGPDSNSTTLLNFKWRDLNWQVAHEINNQIDLIIVRIPTGVPSLGWVNGDWIAVGQPHCFPELGTDFESFAPSFPVPFECYRDKMTPADKVNDTFHLILGSPWLKELSLAENEALVLVPNDLALKTRGKSKEQVLSRLNSMAGLAEALKSRFGTG